MAHPIKLLLALLNGKSKKEIADMLDVEQRQMILQNLPTLHLPRAERRKMERGLKRKNVKDIRNGRKPS